MQVINYRLRPNDLHVIFYQQTVMASHTSLVQQAKACKMKPSGGMKVARIMALSHLCHFTPGWFATPALGSSIVLRETIYNLFTCNLCFTANMFCMLCTFEGGSYNHCTICRHWVKKSTCTSKWSGKHCQTGGENWAIFGLRCTIFEIWSKVDNSS